MKRFMLALALAAPGVAIVAAQQPAAPAAATPATLAQRIAHTDPTKFRPSPRVHDGAGQLDYMALFNSPSFDTNHWFLHRGVIEPKSGIGVHFHNQCEEMFVIFDGEAQFTIDGRTSTVKGPAGVPTRMGHSHAIYNATDKPVQWMNINITQLKGVYDAFNLGDTREGAPLDPIPNFMVMKLDRGQFTANSQMNASALTKGTAQFRRALGPSVFLTTWSYVDHILLAPGAAMKNATPGIGETFYAMAGKGTVTVGNETEPFAAGDAVPIRIGEEKSFENTGTEPLELMVIGVAKDMATKDALTMAGGARGALAGGGGRGGAGRGAGAPGPGRGGPAGAPGAGRGN
jgi:mannose-6-phosphate isomerase-like protein (cupin superfamily)